MSAFRVVFRLIRRRGFRWRVVHALWRLLLLGVGLTVAWRHRTELVRSPDAAERTAGMQALRILSTTPCAVCGRYVDPLEPHTIRINRERRSLRSRLRSPFTGSHSAVVRCSEHA